mmetsp:Transcript_10366/g.36785  ORF Transcript_10366/g.36785 Transcript_10366/m.36785 type:complete len:222 (+) Transcript_10366:2682-3347(+)
MVAPTPTTDTRILSLSSSRCSQILISTSSGSSSFSGKRNFWTAVFSPSSKEEARANAAFSLLSRLSASANSLSYSSMLLGGDAARATTGVDALPVSTASFHSVLSDSGVVMEDEGVSSSAADSAPSPCEYTRTPGRRREPTTRRPRALVAALDLARRSAAEGREAPTPRAPDAMFIFLAPASSSTTPPSPGFLSPRSQTATTCVRSSAPPLAALGAGEACR